MTTVSGSLRFRPLPSASQAEPVAIAVGTRTKRQGSRRQQQEPGQRRQQVPDRADAGRPQRAADPIAVEDDPPRRDRAEDLTEHPRGDDDEDDLRRGADWTTIGVEVSDRTTSSS